MPKNRKTYHITEIEGHPGFFECEAWSQKEPYLVDLFDIEGNGRCSCTDFNTRCLPNWKKNGHQIVDYGMSDRPNPNRTICRHIKFVRWKWINGLLKLCWDQHRKNES